MFEVELEVEEAWERMVGGIAVAVGSGIGERAERPFSWSLTLGLHLGLEI